MRYTGGRTRCRSCYRLHIWLAQPASAPKIRLPPSTPAYALRAKASGKLTIRQTNAAVATRFKPRSALAPTSQCRSGWRRVAASSMTSPRDGGQRLSSRHRRAPNSTPHRASSRMRFMTSHHDPGFRPYRFAQLRDQPSLRAGDASCAPLRAESAGSPLGCS